MGPVTICKSRCPLQQYNFLQSLVHFFDMSKPPPESPKQSKIITPILKQSPNVSSDEEESQIGTPKSMKNSGNQNKAFLNEVINELKQHQQKVKNISKIYFLFLNFWFRIYPHFHGSHIFLK